MGPIEEVSADRPDNTDVCHGLGDPYGLGDPCELGSPWVGGPYRLRDTTGWGTPMGWGT